MCTLSPAPGTPRERRSQRRAGPVGLGYLVQGALPHVASGQWLIMGKDDGVVLGVGLVAALPDPAAVVCERAVEAPVVDREGCVTAWGTLVLPKGASGTPKP